MHIFSNGHKPIGSNKTHISTVYPNETAPNMKDRLIWRT